MARESGDIPCHGRSLQKLPRILATPPDVLSPDLHLSGDQIAIYAQKCVACHADGGKGGGAPGATQLVGDAPLTSGIDVTKTISNFIGYSTTVFDFIRRSMPFNMPMTLSNEEVYALTAYLLSFNQIIGENGSSDTMIQFRMGKIKMSRVCTA